MCLMLYYYYAQYNGTFLWKKVSKIAKLGLNFLINILINRCENLKMLSEGLPYGVIP